MLERRWPFYLAEYGVPLLVVAVLVVSFTPSHFGAVINIGLYYIYLFVLYWCGLLARTLRAAALWVVLLPLIPIGLGWWASRSINLSSKMGNEWAVIDGNPTLFGLAHNYGLLFAIGLTWLGTAAVVRRIAIRAGH